MSVTSTSSPRSGSSSKEKILKSAVALFAAKGFDGCSLRDIALKAKVNVGLIHYFFGINEALLREAYLLVGAGLAERRLHLLRDAQAHRNEQPLSVEKIVELFLLPAFEISRQGPRGKAFLKMQARLQLEQNRVSRDLRATLYDESSQQFLQALKYVLPFLSDTTLCWRYIFVLGAYQYTLADTGRLEVVSRGLCSGGDMDEAMAQIVAFLSAGLRAP